MDPLAEAKQLFLDALALQETGDLERAAGFYRKALALVPERPSVMNNLAAAYIGLNRHAEAKLLCERLLESNPQDESALLNLGICQVKLGSPGEALAWYGRALEVRPDNATVLINLSGVLLELKRPQEALASCDRALAVKPDSAEALHNRANALRELKRPQEALASYERALDIRPGFVDALHGMGNALLDLGRYQEAADTYEKVLASRPDLEYVSGNLACARMYCCDWRGRKEGVGCLVSAIRAGKRDVVPFAALGITDSPQDLLMCSRIWVRDKCPASAAPVWKGEHYRHDRIRLAYLSADFRVHPSSFLLAGMFEHHDRSRFETMALSFGDDDQSEIRSRLKTAFEHFIDVCNRGDLDIARLMRELEVDIAVDLTGHTQYSRTGIFALRPAPIQVNYLGYPGTMGAEYIDYIIADEFVIPRDHQVHYSEKVAYLPDCYQVNDSMRRIAEHTPTRAEVGLPERGFVFCSFNNSYKITPAVFDVWMRLLREVEGSVLWLLEANAAVARNLRREAADRGIAPERLVFAPRIKVADHLARHRLADLFLDTLPFNAHTTASDALWAGLPVLTCLGTTFAGRVAASLLNAIGLPELITHSLEEYERRALELATNPKLLADIKSKLARNRNTYPLFNTDRFRRHIEAAYTTMWERYQRGKPPESFAVEPRKQLG
jgi:predicted O-linked N-acetylglucosamine transferase (SPINDLY family)